MVVTQVWCYLTKGLAYSCAIGSSWQRLRVGPILHRLPLRLHICACRLVLILCDNNVSRACWLPEPLKPVALYLFKSNFYCLKHFPLKTAAATITPLLIQSACVYIYIHIYICILIFCLCTSPRGMALELWDTSFSLIRKRHSLQSAALFVWCYWPTWAVACWSVTNNWTSLICMMFGGHLHPHLSARVFLY